MLGFGINTLSVVPCRAEPSSKSEMITQLLFGETYRILECQKDWFKIKISTDNYEGWINHLQHHEITEQTFNQLVSSEHSYNADIFQVLQFGNNPVISPFGAHYYNFNNNKFILENISYETFGRVINRAKKLNHTAIVDYALMFLNAPYLWGGKTIMGIDCSGFTQNVYKLAGYLLPRDAKDQAVIGTPITFLDEVQAGDLAFFHNEEGIITHTGIMINNEKIIHASGKVKIDRIDHYGIYSSELKKHTHFLRVIKRL